VSISTTAAGARAVRLRRHPGGRRRGLSEAAADETVGPGPLAGPRARPTASIRASGGAGRPDGRVGRFRRRRRDGQQLVRRVPVDRLVADLQLLLCETQWDHQRDQLQQHERQDPVPGEDEQEPDSRGRREAVEVE